MTLETTALVSLVVTVSPLETITLPGHLGRAVYQFLLDYIGQFDSSFAKSLHDKGGRKPFTCSELMGGERIKPNTVLYSSGQSAWFRLTSVSPEMAIYMHQLAAQPPPTLLFDNQTFRVMQACTDSASHPWAGHISYETLSMPYMLGQAEPLYKLPVEFYSPTVFRSKFFGAKRRNWPLPLPRWVFGSLIKQWNSYSPVQIPNELLEFIESYMVISQFQLETRATPLKNSSVTGFVGTVIYDIINHDRYWSRLINMLLGYAFYCGVGYQTTVGMGQTRLQLA